MIIKTIKKLTDYKWLNLFDVEYENKDGKIGHWNFVSRKSEPKIGADLTADAVVIIPILKTGKTRKLVILEEFRIPLGDVEYSFPAGLFDSSESAIKCATRELREETGLEVTKILYISSAAVSSAGLSDESVVYVVCECAGTISTSGNEGSEEIKVIPVDIEELKQIHANPKNKVSAKALPFMLMFEALGKFKWPKVVRNV